MQPYVLLQAAGSDQADEWIRLATDSQMAGKFGEADKFYRNALRLDPCNAVATQNLATLHAQTGQVCEGLLAIERAVMFDSKNAIIMVNRSFMCLECDRIEDALKSAQDAVALHPTTDGPVKAEDLHGYVASRLALAMVNATAGTPEKSIKLYQEILDKDPKHPLANVNGCFTQTLTTATPEQLLQSRRRCYESIRYTGPKKPHDNQRTTNRPIRVGYVGGDFKRHSAAMIFGAVVLHHDKTVVEPYLYSTLPVSPANDPMTKQFMDMAGANWRDISTMSDDDVDALIRKDQIDILVDLAAHTNGGRLSIFTRKPAPVQVSAWGFAHGTGVPEIDYFFADPIAVQPEERTNYSEKVIDLPCIVTYLSPVEYNLKATSMLPYFKNDYITFGSYARYEKMSDTCLSTLAEIIRQVPNSRMEFKDHAFRRPYSIKRVMSAMADIDPKRLLFSISTTHFDHMLTYQQADILCDPFPHGGGIVSLEQLYMGVPLVTLYGTQASGRSAASVLTQMGREDWIAHTPEEYIEKAVAMANDIPMLSKARKTLREEFLNSPVVKGYREAVESKYKEMWATWVQQCSR